MKKQWNVGILIFNEVEVMDFAGPFEVFSITRDPETDRNIFKVHTIAHTNQVIQARNGLKVLPEYDFANCPEMDVVIIPGGYGAEMIEIHNSAILDWIKEKATSCELIASVCTGAFLLAEAGILNGKKATTHWMDLEKISKEYPAIEVIQNVKFVDEGNILTAGGISAGIDLSFHILKRLVGVEIARATAKRMEYEIEII